MLHHITHSCIVFYRHTHTRFSSRKWFDNLLNDLEEVANICWKPRVWHNYHVHVFSSNPFLFFIFARCTFSVLASNRVLLQLLLRGSQQAFSWQITVGSTKMKCQCYFKIRCQIPCLDFREQAAKAGIGRGVQCIWSYSHHCSCRGIFTVIPWLLKQCMQNKLTAKSLCRDTQAWIEANSENVKIAQLFEAQV